MKESAWTSEADFKSECLAGSQDIKGSFFLLGEALSSIEASASSYWHHFHKIN